VSDQVYEPVQFSVKRFQFAQLVTQALPAVPASATLPVGTCAKVTAREGSLCVAATSQQLSIFAESPAVTVALPGEVFLPARRLAAILSESPEADVTVTVKGGFAVVTAGGASWQLKLPNPEGFSGLPDLAEARFSPAGREKFLAGLNAVKHAVGRDAGRPAFTQACVAEHDGVMYVTATDSAQFSRAPVPGFPFPLAVPAGALDDLVKLLGKGVTDGVEVADCGPYAVFRVKPVTMAVLKSAYPFPDVNRLVLAGTARNDLTLGVDKRELADALKRVAVNADPKTAAVSLVADSTGVSPRLTVTGRDLSQNSAEQVIPATWSGGHLVLTVSAVFLSKMLAAYPGPTCEFRVAAPRGRVKPALLLEDKDAGVTCTCPQMAVAPAGAGEESG
jgi:DNA polymerase III sliding clamp (beta) subunit (PCNA family)